MNWQCCSTYNNDKNKQLKSLNSHTKNKIRNKKEESVKTIN